MAEWVRTLDWRPGGPGFESRCGNFASHNVQINQIPYIPRVFVTLP